MIKIRNAEKGDIPKLLELNEELYKNEFHYDETINVAYSKNTKEKDCFEKYISSNKYAAYVAESDTKVIGYLIGTMVPSDSFRKNIKIALSESMFVESEYRNMGIGKQLRQQFYKWAKKNNADILRSRVSAKNKDKIRFDKREGFEEYEIILEKKIS